MTERLIIEDDEAHALAHELAERRGTTIDEAVVASLREALSATKPDAPQDVPAAVPFRSPTLEEMTPEQRARYDALGALVRELAPHVRPGASSDHRDMYDEYGLPK